ncbi:MAG TPA: LysM peptidoglycan-binding domain-containing protein [Candidatus Saccharimonadales bacterium]
MRPLPIVRKIRIFTGGLVLGIGVVLAGAVPVAAVEQGGLGGRPAHPRAGNARSESIFIHTLDAGKQAIEGVQVINNTAETKKVLVYAVDSQVSSGGAFACAQAADKPVGVGSWIDISQKEVTLAPASKQTVDFNIAVPKDATPGEHNGCIIIQDTKQQASPDSNGIVLSLRSAIRVAITVPGNIQKGLVFTGLGLDKKTDEKIVLSAALKNNGNVSLDTELEVGLRSLVAFSAKGSGGNFPVLGGSEGRFNFETKQPFWGGWYRLVATARYNNDPTVALGQGRPTTAIEKSTWVFLAPRPVAAIIELLGLVMTVAALIVYRVRRKQRLRAMRQAIMHTVKQHENLHTIASQYGMSWKRLARMNKLKPPFQLKTGQTLHVLPSATRSAKKPPTKP